MVRLFRIPAVVTIFSICVFISAQTAPSSSEENAAMEKYAKSLGLRWNIHAFTTRASDGSKGFGLGVSPMDMPGIGNRPGEVPQYVNQSEANLHSRVCAAAAIVVAEELDSRVAITGNKFLIYTKHTMGLSRILKGPPNLTVGQSINLVYPGGSLVDEGERVTIDFPHLLPIVVGRSYLLILMQPQDAPAGLFFPGTGHLDDNIRVVDGRIVLDAGSHENFASGEPVDDIAAEIDKLVTKVPCSQP